MNKKALKVMASAMVLTFGLSIVPMPALAVSSNIVAETKNLNTLTISQVQDLAVINNDTAKKLQLSMKRLDLNRTMLNNDRRTTQNSINSMDVGSGSSAGLVQMQSVLADLKEQLAKPENKNNATLKAQVAAMEMQVASAEASINSAYASMASGFESALAGLDQLDDAIDNLNNNDEDLTKNMKDLEVQMRYTASNLCLNVVKLDKSIELLEKRIALADKTLQVYELQNKLGMNIVTDVESQQTAKREAEKALEDAKDGRTTLKRSINVLIGRDDGSPLEIVPMHLPVAIDPAPAYTEDLIKHFTDMNYTLKTLDRDIADLKDSVEDDTDSDERRNVDYQVESKKQDIKTQKQAVSDSLKALLAEINSNGEAYQVSRQKYLTEKKNYEYTQKRYELGMVSDLQMRGAELSLQSAEVTNLENGYQYYLSWQKYYTAEKGVDITSL